MSALALMDLIRGEGTEDSRFLGALVIARLAQQIEALVRGMSGER